MGSKGIVASTAALVGAASGRHRRHHPHLAHARARRRPQPRSHRRPGNSPDHGFRSFMPLVIACPGCGRTTSTVFQELAGDIQSYVRRRSPQWQEAYPGFETLQLAVMGCIVNGPGESKHADIGISLPGTGELSAAPVYIDGKKAMVLRGADIGKQFKTSSRAISPNAAGGGRRKSQIRSSRGNNSWRRCHRQTRAGGAAAPRSGAAAPWRGAPRHGARPSSHRSSAH